jgi:glucosamine 6-phosphate synthetase-like amidotransferase/phosphosugar isomerase protein
VAVIHNGTINNSYDLKKELQAKGIVFLSETDTEVIAHLIGEYVHLYVYEYVLYLYIYTNIVLLIIIRYRYIGQYQSLNSKDAVIIH